MAGERGLNFGVSGRRVFFNLFFTLLIQKIFLGAYMDSVRFFELFHIEKSISSNSAKFWPKKAKMFF